MDLTEGTLQEKTARAKKNMMWFAMLSMFMTFAGLTSAYIVSSERKDWIDNFIFPSSFYISLSVLIISSVLFYLFKKAIKTGKRSTATTLLLATFVSATIFVVLQFKGFGEIIAQGFYPTGSAATVTTSFIYAIVFVHLLHIFGGVIVLTVVLIKHLKGKYTQENYLGVQLAEMYWHFVDVLWIYLFGFLLFM